MDYSSCSVGMVEFVDSSIPPSDSPLYVGVHLDSLVAMVRRVEKTPTLIDSEFMGIDVAPCLRVFDFTRQLLEAGLSFVEVEGELWLPSNLAVPKTGELILFGVGESVELLKGVLDARGFLRVSVESSVVVSVAQLFRDAQEENGRLVRAHIAEVREGLRCRYFEVAGSS